MPLLNNDKSTDELKIQEGWFAVRRFVKANFEKRPDINAILFLIGLNEVGVVKESWEKEEKQDLMHIAICRLFEPLGYYKETHRDEDGWPHFESLTPMPKIELKEQDSLLKTRIVMYFKERGYI